MWLNTLHAMYISDKNVEKIINKSTLSIFEKTGKNIDKNYDKLFFEIFNTIASNVFSVESKNPVLQTKEPDDALNIINNIVINEIVKYILTKKLNLLNKDITVVKEKNKEEVAKEIIKISLEKNETKFISPIEHITDINIISLHMYTQDYNITEYTNTLVILYNNEKIKIKIKPGNYTPDTLCDTLNNVVFNKIQKTVNFYVSQIDNTLLFSSQYIEIPSDDLDSTINNILGINTGDPIKLIKRNKLQLNIEFIFENELYNFEYSNPIVINYNRTAEAPILKEFMINYKKKFLYPVDLTEVKIDFDNYNHRGYPYYLMIEITKLI